MSKMHTLLNYVTFVTYNIFRSGYRLVSLNKLLKCFKNHRIILSYLGPIIFWTRPCIFHLYKFNYKFSYKFSYKLKCHQPCPCMPLYSLSIIYSDVKLIPYNINPHPGSDDKLCYSIKCIDVCLLSLYKVQGIDLSNPTLVHHLLSSRVFFETEKDAECIARQMVEREKLLFEDDKFCPAQCDFPYCPALLSICSIVICGKPYYYFSHIPHAHDSPIYQGDLSTLSPFCQKVLYYYSGLQLCDGSTESLDSSLLSLMQYITEEKRRLLIEDCMSSLKECARNTLGCELDSGIEISNTFDGM